MTNTFTMTDNRTNKSYEFDILDGTRGPSVVDISSFYSQTGMFTYDQGYTSTASTKSAITFIDGDKGELRHRGVEISELVENHSYIEVCYLLLNKRLPTSEEAKSFDLELRHRSFIHERMRGLFDSFPISGHPMAIMN